MKRKITSDLIRWKNNDKRKPLLIHGARQVGKTYIIQEFAKEYYEDYVYVNFDTNKSFDDLFAKNINPDYIISQLEKFFGKKIEAGKTLIIFDEIQASERALNSLKYFCEDARDQHIIAAGSLLGVAINREKFSFPVGKVDVMNLYPMDFEEFLLANNKDALINEIKECYKTTKQMSGTLHDMAIDLYKQYLIVGGMPEAVQGFINEESELAAQNIIGTITDNYIADMSKYATKTESVKIMATFESIPAQLAKENRKFQYKIVQKGGTANMYGEAIAWLTAAGMILKCNKVSTALHPLNAYQDLTSFKIYASDPGILTLKSGYNLFSILESNNNLFLGAIVENYVANALRSNGFDLKYWESSGKAEVDFLIESGDKVIPIEVKAGDNTKSRSLSVYKDNYQPLYSIRVSTKNFGFVNNIKSVPLYAVFCIQKENLDL